MMLAAPPFKNKHLDLPFMAEDVITLINSKICKVNNLLQVNGVNAVRLCFTFIDIYNDLLVGPFTVDETLHCYNVVIITITVIIINTTRQWIGPSPRDSTYLNI